MKILMFLILSMPYNKNKNSGLPTFLLDSIVVHAKTQNTHAIYDVSDSIIKLKKTSFNEEIFNIIPSLSFEYVAKGYGIVNFRGYDIKKLTIAMDGIPMSIPYSGMFDLSQIPSGFINSVLVIPASAPILAGKDAIGGIININSAKIQKTRRFSLSIGNGNTFENNAFIGDTGKIFSYIIGYSYSHQDGIVISDDNPYKIYGVLPNSYSIKRGIIAKIRINTKAGKTKLNALYLNNKKGVPPEQDVNRPKYWRFPVWKRMTLVLRHRWRHMRLGLYHDKYYNILDSYDDSTYATQNARYAFHSTYDDFTYGGYIQNNHNICDWNITGILSFKKDVHREQPDYNEKWRKLYAFSSDFGLFAKKSFSTSTLSYSTEFIYHSQGPRKYLSPQFTAYFSKAFKYFSAVLAIGRKIRFPTLKEMYSTYLGSAYPNPDLKPETSYNIDLKNTFRTGSHTMYIGLFYSYTDNLIQKIRIDSLYKTVNIESSTSKGAECGINGVIGDISYSIFSSYNNTRDNKGRPVDLVPKWKAGIIFSKPFVLKSTLYSEILYTGKRNAVEKDTIYTLPAYTQINLTLQKKYGHLTTYLKVNNLLDVFYEYDLGIPARGRYIEGGIKVEF